MAMLQLKCPKSGEPIDIQDVPPHFALSRHNAYNASAWGTEIPCPHCAETHIWTSSEWIRALQTLRDSPKATRLLIDGDHVRAEM
jgi:endogenous inhibitor of DNA gyrase (YacG/DUF329 family)